MERCFAPPREEGLQLVQNCNTGSSGWHRHHELSKDIPSIHKVPHSLVAGGKAALQYCLPALQFAPCASKFLSGIRAFCFEIAVCSMASTTALASIRTVFHWDLSVLVLLCMSLSLPFFICSLLWCITNRNTTHRKSRRTMDTFDLNADYTPLNEYSQVPSSQLEDQVPWSEPEDLHNYGYGRSYESLVGAAEQEHAPTTDDLEETQPFNDMPSQQTSASNGNRNKPSASLRKDKAILERERGSNWLEHETLLLIDGKRRLGEDMQTGTLMRSMKSKQQRWEFVSSFLKDMGVNKTPIQCDYKWSRLWKPFKIIFDYEKAIPSGKDSYWRMPPQERSALKMPRYFDRTIYDALKQKFGGDRAVNPGSILLDTSTPSLPGNERSSVCIDNPVSHDSQTDASNGSTDVMEISPSKLPLSTGKKRARVPRGSAIKRDLSDSTRDLLEFLGTTEENRNKKEDDIQEISKNQFETNIRLQQRRIAAAEQSSEALNRIADALGSFTAAMTPQREHH